MNQELTAPNSSKVFETLAAIDRGNLVLDLEDALREVVTASMYEQKSGKVSLVLTFDPDTTTGAMRVSAEVKSSPPKPKKKASIFFPTPEGNLSRSDHRQQEMFGERA